MSEAGLRLDPPRQQQGSDRLAATFARLRAADELGLFPYLMTGFPDPATCAELMDALATAGADGLELGVPFSDPLADGVTIQRVGAAALEQGASLKMALELLREFRTHHEIPVVFMSYFNLVLAYGPEMLAHDGAAAGLDGLIVPDLPLEEAGPLKTSFDRHGIKLVFLVAPTSTPARLAHTAELASGFVYCVALLGVTGAREQLSQELPAFLQRVRQQCSQPLVAGFGISKPEHVRALRGLADGAIVASSLADVIEGTPEAERIAAVAAYVSQLKQATRAAQPGREAALPTAPLRLDTERLDPSSAWRNSG